MIGWPGSVTQAIFRHNQDSVALLDLVSGDSMTYRQLINEIGTARDEMAHAAGRQRGPIVIPMHRRLSSVVAMLAGADGDFSVIPVDPHQPEGKTSAVIHQTGAIGIFDAQSGVFARRGEDAQWDTALRLGGGPLFFTSGTTGSPKGIAHSWANLLANGEAFVKASGIDTNARLLHVFPLAYMAGFLNTVLVPLLAGGQVLLGRQFDPLAGATFRIDVERGEATTSWLSPSMVESILRLDRGEGSFLDTFSTCFCGTGRMTNSSRAAFEQRFGCRLLNSYGTSELLILTLEASDASSGLVPVSVGRVLPGVEIRELSSSARGDNSNKELVAQVPWPALGYVRGGAIHDLETTEGYFKTRDYGRVDSHRITISGRIDGVVVKGGVNVFPETIEDVLLKHPSVAAAALVGIPHAYWGDEPVVAVEVRPEIVTEDVEQELMHALRAEVPTDQLPTRIVLVSQIPKSGSGKVLRTELEALLREFA